MLNSLRLATVFLFFAILLFVQDSNPAKQSTSQKNPCDWAMTQQDLNQCSGEQYRKADGHLNAVYVKLMNMVEKDLAEAQKQSDAERKAYSETVVQKLKAAERAWIQYRDLHCDAARHQYEGGSMSPMVWADCMTTTTDHRIVDLKNAYGSGDRTLE
jgi:uncharacterized protein YecT (DUF1311 family)